MFFPPQLRNGGKSILLDQRQQLERGSGRPLFGALPLADQTARHVQIVGKTVWPTCSLSRIALISAGFNGRMGVRQASSKHRIVCLSMAPTPRRASMVSWMAAIALLRYFLRICFSSPQDRLSDLQRQSGRQSGRRRMKQCQGWACEGLSPKARRTPSGSRAITVR